LATFSVATGRSVGVLECWNTAEWRPLAVVDGPPTLQNSTTPRRHRGSYASPYRVVMRKTSAVEVEAVCGETAFPPCLDIN